PQGQRRLDRPLAFQTQIDALALLRLQIELEQVVVLANLPAVEWQCVAGTLREEETAVFTGKVELEVIERRVGQLQQPGTLALLLHRAIFNVQTQPEHRARITGIEYGFVMQTEAALHGRRGDIVDAGVAAHVLEDVHALPQRQNAHFFVEGNGAHERGKNEAHEEQEQPVHTTPQTLSDDIGAPFPLDDVITHGRLIFESPYSRGWRSAFPDSGSSLPCASSIYPGQPWRTPLRQTGTITLLRAATRRSLVISSRTMKTPNYRPIVLCMSGHDPSG